MRSKFSELIDAGVAKFQHEPIAPKTPDPTDYMSRLYNMYWGAATDSHMSVTQDGRRIITGRITQDPCKWMDLVICNHWGGIDWCQSGYCSLAEFLAQNGVKAVVTTHNGEQGMQIVPDDDVPSQYSAPKVVTTTESKIPQPISVLGDTNSIQEAFENAHNAKQLVENLNRSKWIAGNKWFVYEDKAACSYETPNGLITYIMEISASKANIINNDEFRQLMEAEGLGDVQLVQYNNYFRLESNDKKWDVLLSSWKDNKINESSFDSMTVQNWVDHIKWMLSVFN